MTSAYPPGRFGALKTEGDVVTSFHEKPRGDGSLVNAGFFVLEPSVIDLIYGDECTWEEEPLKNLAQARELMTFKHRG